MLCRLKMMISSCSGQQPSRDVHIHSHRSVSLRSVKTKRIANGFYEPRRPSTISSTWPSSYKQLFSRSRLCKSLKSLRLVVRAFISWSARHDNIQALSPSMARKIIIIIIVFDYFCELVTTRIVAAFAGVLTYRLVSLLTANERANIFEFIFSYE